MFKFAFDIEGDGDEAVPQTTPAPAPRASRPPGKSVDMSMPDLIRTLPDVISYSPLPHPVGGRPLLRRDLYDARFQLALGEGSSKVASEPAAPEPNADGDDAGYVDADTDLIPGTYEGGLKSWEGGVDLVEVIARGVGLGEAGGKGEGGEDARVAEWARGARVLELGCGTGLPSAYLLRALLSFPAPADAPPTIIHVQDFNLPVLSLVTLPNLVLAALPSLPVSARAAAEAAASDDEGVADDDAAEAPKRPFDETRAGTLELTPALLDAFTSVLEERGVQLRFTYGDWGGMARTLGAHDLVLTAETIYAEDSVAPLLDAIEAAAKPAEDAALASVPAPQADSNDDPLSDSLEALNVRDEWAATPLADPATPPLVLVAAKVLYFGVGGGLDAFLDEVQARRGWHTRVRDWVRGVGRAVVRIGW